MNQLRAMRCLAEEFDMHIIQNQAPTLSIAAGFSIILDWENPKRNEER
jgi:hypothetical protein